MKCAWKELLEILPPWISKEADRHWQNTLQEIRMRIGMPPELISAQGNYVLMQRTSLSDLDFCINAASHYSPWNISYSDGYLTAPGGHRIGICGTAVIQNNKISTIKDPSSLCVRVARDFPGIGEKAASLSGNILIIGPPGSGKTTLLRDIVRNISDRGPGSVAVVDERGELFPGSHGKGYFQTGARTDILTGCPKPLGIDTVLRTMGPDTIVLDEITAEQDCDALLRAGWCGVRLLATAHASCASDLISRKIYRKLYDSGLFDSILKMQPDKSWRQERLGKLL